MADPAVFNASPLIFLSRAGLAELARLAGDDVIVPRAVLDEIKRFGPDDPAVALIRQTEWRHVVDSEPVPPIIERWDLGRGETSVLTWAYQHAGTAVLDDLAARRCARSLAIPVRGTLGLILIAKQRGIIPAARPILEQLRRTGMYLSEAVVNRALATVGE